VLDRDFRVATVAPLVGGHFNGARNAKDFQIFIETDVCDDFSFIRRIHDDRHIAVHAVAVLDNVSHRSNCE
jgi:hypothetical protein